LRAARFEFVAGGDTRAISLMHNATRPVPSLL
jgi:hypothetical protein